MVLKGCEPDVILGGIRHDTYGAHGGTFTLYHVLPKLTVFAKLSNDSFQSFLDQF